MLMPEESLRLSLVLNGKRPQAVRRRVEMCVCGGGETKELAAPFRSCSSSGVLASSLPGEEGRGRKPEKERGWEEH